MQDYNTLLTTHHVVNGELKRKNHQWTLAELDYLKRQWINSTLSVSEIADSLDLTYGQVRSQLKARKWKRKRHHRNVNNREGYWYCSCCKEYKPIDDFYIKSRYPKLYYNGICKECSKAKQKEIYSRKVGK